MSTTKKACPFCGGDASFNEHSKDCYFTLLELFKANARSNPDNADLSDCFKLLQAWNTRHSAVSDADAVNAALKEAWQKHVATMDPMHDTSGNNNFFTAGFKAALYFLGATSASGDLNFKDSDRGN